MCRGGDTHAPMKTSYWLISTRSLPGCQSQPFSNKGTTISVLKSFKKYFARSLSQKHSLSKCENVTYVTRNMGCEGKLLNVSLFGSRKYKSKSKLPSSAGGSP